jgi:KUP system potassium uptake protein
MTPSPARLPALTLAALGVVFGDIGTSPLYAMKEVFAGEAHAVPISAANILGVLSLVVWTLLLVVTVKYAGLVMRADNRGEGGVMALMALAGRHARGAQALTLLGLVGAALFYGDGMITPAISVLSAVEGLGVAAPGLAGAIIPVTLVILFALFWVQRGGTARVGKFFGPVTSIWFLVLAVLGVMNIVRAPEVLAALSPHYALAFFVAEPAVAFFSLGAVFLAVTGAETLYADMGHFGAKPVRLAWVWLVLPALTLNYFGQGALLLVDPATISHPFYRMAPEWALVPLIVLAAAATVIASQAVISGVYSVTHQAIQLGYAPRMRILHTSSDTRGQIYLPTVNWLLFIAVAVLVIGFGSSTALASAYGISVSGTMVVTTILVYSVARHVWRWGRVKSLAVFGSLLLIDLAFLAANVGKIDDGGWFPLALAAVLLVLMTTWKDGRALLARRRDGEAIPLDAFVESMSAASVPTVSGSAVFLTPDAAKTPHALLHSLKHYKSLHERVLILNVRFADEPYVAAEKRVEITPLAGRFERVQVTFGFMDRPDLPAALVACKALGIAEGFADTTFFLGRETLATGAQTWAARRRESLPARAEITSRWRAKLFIALSRNAGTAADFLGLPPNRVVELGARVVL